MMNQTAATRPTTPTPAATVPPPSTTSSTKSSSFDAHQHHEQDQPSCPPPSGSPRTFSFFDVISTDRTTPSPAPRLFTGQRRPPSFSPSPLSLSRATSIHDKLPTASTQRVDVDNQLSPLHRSPSLDVSSASLSSWPPPPPIASDDIALRLIPRSTYLLGEGRYAQVYLAAYKKNATAESSSASLDSHLETMEGKMHVEHLSSSSWQLCAVKRMAADRQSQTMGLREAFFLNRLTGQESIMHCGQKGDRNIEIKQGRRFIVKLIAVKEDRQGSKNGSHSRSSSEAVQGSPTSKLVARRRSLTSGIAAIKDETAYKQAQQLSSFASVPSLEEEVMAPAASRLMLLLEHAPLGTLDRILRTSPLLVGACTWERWAREGSAALAWVHNKGILHADVKPDNILLTHDLHLRLTDFGSSLLIHPAHPITDGAGLGTLPFSSPELVDPCKTFSFPVDVFALGATLYQCVTGREPYRGLRAVEMMYHVRRGGLWEWEERQRLEIMGSGPANVSESPYPSAWRQQLPQGVKRGGSLRNPLSLSAFEGGKIPRPSSTESLHASRDLVDDWGDEKSPAGVKLWAKWIRTPVTSSPVTSPMASLLAEDSQAVVNPLTSFLQPQNVRPVSPPQIPDRSDEPREGVTIPYDDGSPAMIFVNGCESLRSELRDVMRMMVDPNPGHRPRAADLLTLWGDR